MFNVNHAVLTVISLFVVSESLGNNSIISLSEAFSPTHTPVHFAGNTMITHTSPIPKCTSLHMAISKKILISPARRSVFKKVMSSLFFSTALSLKFPMIVQAKSKETITPEMVKASFAAVREQLESPDGGIQTLQSLIEKEDYDAILEFTKYYDLEFRKAKMVKARKFITGSEDKERGLYLSNSVTFDLIGMNKGCRPGKKDITEVTRYWEELKMDVENFLKLEKAIDFSVYEG